MPQTRRRVGVTDEGHNRVVNYLWRHTAASSLIMMGLDLPTIAKLLGTSVEMLNKHYGHLLDDHLARAAESLARAQRSMRAGVRSGASGGSAASAASGPTAEPRRGPGSSP